MPKFKFSLNYEKVIEADNKDEAIDIFWQRFSEELADGDLYNEVHISELPKVFKKQYTEEKMCSICGRKTNILFGFDENIDESGVCLNCFLEIALEDKYEIVEVV